MRIATLLVPTDSSICLEQAGIYRDEHTQSEHLGALLECALRDDLTFLEILDDFIVGLTQRARRVTIDGDTFRHATDTYRFGGPRMDALLPIAYLDRIELGYRDANAPALAIWLTDTPPPYSERVNLIGRTVINVAENYGFMQVDEELFDHVFGITTRAFGFTHSVDRIEIYSHKRIAIYVGDFGRPKRWELRNILRKMQ